ncbi:MAG: hypothetical protein FJY85_18415, partial [Deltaproteobacteria bacterium]|nr:hypothetical protein [Deltaproteobacteria bacterium]
MAYPEVVLSVAQGRPKDPVIEKGGIGSITQRLQVKIGCIPVTGKLLLVVLSVLALVPWISIPRATARPNEHPMDAATQAVLASVRIPLDSGLAVDSKDEQSSRGSVKPCGVRAIPLAGKKAGPIWGSPRPHRTQFFTAASGRGDVGPKTEVWPSAQSTHDGPKSSIPPYEEKKRIALPDTFGAGEGCSAAAYEAVTAEYLEFLDIGALLCFSCNKSGKARICREARSKADFHQFVHDLEIVRIFPDREPREGVLFVARHTSGGSGWCDFITLR